jgi:phosphoglycolate phosphatase-like HAD superfamily hydrolase
MIAVIFDIDGTLVESFQFDGNIYVSAVKDVLGDVIIKDNWNHYKNITDTGILRQIMDENKICEEGQIGKVRKKFGDLVRQHLENSGECRPKKGAIGLIGNLLSDRRYKVGFATGGWRHTAEMKLQQAGFDLKNAVLFSSDDSDKRVGIMKRCLLALGSRFNRIVYIGDAEWDLQAAETLGWHFIGVGARLEGKCDFWVEDFSDQNLFMRMLHVCYS